MKKYLFPILMFAVFEAIAITLWLSKDNLFYLFNFSYIGISITIGLSLMITKNKYGRRNPAFSGIIYVGLFRNHMQ